MIEVKKGCFHYPGGEMILKDISFRLEAGEILTILGQNGIGKTTLIKCLTGIYSWTSGEVVIDGKVIHKTSDITGLGYVPQAHPLSFPYTVRQIVMMGRVHSIGLFSVPSEKDKQAVEKVMKEVGIMSIADRSCTTLSGGQLQLAFIARALVSDPTILILDEPESHLDFKNQFLLLELIQRLVRERKLSCIMNTHFPEHALSISDKTLILGKNHQFIFDDTTKVITEDNMKKYFDIRARIVDVPGEKDACKAFVVTDVI